MPEITLESLADILEETACLLELKGESPSRIRTFRQGAEVVRSSDDDVVQRARERDFKSIGTDLEDELHELASTGRLEIHDRLRDEFPDTLIELLKLEGLDPGMVKTLHESLQISSLGALKRACQSGKLDTLTGFGPQSAKTILHAIDDYQQAAGFYFRADVEPVAEQIVKLLRRHPEVSHAEVAGAYRRKEETVRDLVFLVATKKAGEVSKFFTELEEIHQVIFEGSSKAAVRLKSGLKCDLRAVAPSEWPFALLHATGSREHHLELRSRATEQGLKLNEYHLAPVDGKTWNDSTATILEEADIYRELGLPFVAPERREKHGELEDIEQDGSNPLASRT